MSAAAKQLLSREKSPAARDLLFHAKKIVLAAIK